jgi:hypothetical protein
MRSNRPGAGAATSEPAGVQVQVAVMAAFVWYARHASALFFFAISKDHKTDADVLCHQTPSSHSSIELLSYPNPTQPVFCRTGSFNLSILPSLGRAFICVCLAKYSLSRGMLMYLAATRRCPRSSESIISNHFSCKFLSRIIG